jgi:hypothetical protein
MQLWFSTNNGLMIYNPIVLFTLIGIAFMRKIRPGLSLFLIFYFVFISYVFSSWWCWSYGCSYGSRPFVEYYTLFSLPLSFFIRGVKNKFLLFTLGSILIILIALNLKLIFEFNGCWNGGDWDWKEFSALLF